MIAYAKRLGARRFLEYEHVDSDLEPGQAVRIIRHWRDDRREITSDMFCYRTIESDEGKDRGKRIVKAVLLGPSESGISPDKAHRLTKEYPVVNPQHVFSYGREKTGEAIE